MMSKEQGPSRQKLTYTKEELLNLKQSPLSQGCPQALLPQNRALIYGILAPVQGMPQEDEVHGQPAAKRNPIP